MNKPVTSTLHGGIDYIFACTQIFTSSCFSINAEAAKIYQAMGLAFATFNAFTDTPVGINKIISFKDHRKIDAAFLAGLSLLSFTKMIRKDKRTFYFHPGFLAAAITNFALTDYDATSNY